MRIISFALDLSIGDPAVTRQANILREQWMLLGLEMDIPTQSPKALVLANFTPVPSIRENSDLHEPSLAETE